MGGVKLLNGIKSMYVDSSACVKVKGGESERFRVDKWGETRMYHILLAFKYIYGSSDEESEDGDGKEGDEVPGGWKRVNTT